MLTRVCHWSLSWANWCVWKEITGLK